VCKGAQDFLFGFWIFLNILSFMYVGESVAAAPSYCLLNTNHLPSNIIDLSPENCKRCYYPHSEDEETSLIRLSNFCRILWSGEAKI
jgi:hypothetical protein